MTDDFPAGPQMATPIKECSFSIQLYLFSCFRMVSYWTLKRKAKAIVQRQLEAMDHVEQEELSDGDGGDEMELTTADMEDRAGGAADLGEELTRWAVEENIPRSSLGKLLKILKCHHPSLPADPRTLLKTKRSEVLDVKSKAGGTYYHFGTLASMTATLEAHQSVLSEGMCLELQVNVDGLPLFKSSSTQFWPILGYIRNIPTHRPFVITLFLGKVKA